MLLSVERQGTLLNPVAIRRVTAPSVEPLTLAQVKSHLRIVSTQDDANIPNWITAARQEAERLTGEKFITQTWELTYSRFPPGVFPLSDSIDSFGPASWFGFSSASFLLEQVRPVKIINSIKYLDVAGAQQTQDPTTYSLLADTQKPRIISGLDQIWPMTAPVENAVVVNLDAGFGDTAADVPGLYIQAMLLMCGHFSENREAVVVADSRVQAIEIPLGIRDLLTTPKVG